MQLQQISLSPDIKKLLDEGYDITITENGGLLMAHRIPYLNSKREIKFGTLVATLNLATPTLVGKPPDHTMYFIGETPYNSDGSEVNGVINANVQLLSGIAVNFHYSRKPKKGHYDDYFEKFCTYAEVFCSQARSVDSSVTYKPNNKKAA